MKEWIISFLYATGSTFAIIVGIYVCYHLIVYIFSLPIMAIIAIIIGVWIVMETLAIRQAREDKRLGRTTDRAFPG